MTRDCSLWIGHGRTTRVLEGHLSRMWSGGCGCQLGSCPQKVLRATAKAAGLPQKVSGRYLGTIELRQNILEHVLASTQVGMRWVTVRGSLYVAEITQRDRPALHGI